MRTQMSLLTYLFPFGFGINTDQEPIITQPGSAVLKVSSVVCEGAPLDQALRFSSPQLDNVTATTLTKQLDRTIYVQLIDSGITLKGQLLQLDKNQFRFVGAPQVHASDSLTPFPLKPTDFAPHDLTTDLIQLHRVRELEVLELDKLAHKLRAANLDRDRYSLWASTDSLTGLANRRAFWREVSSKLSAPVNHPAGCSPIVLMLDVDQFRTLNEDYGDQTGDQVLVTIARELINRLDDADILGRLGGDEFGIYLHSSNPSAAEKLIAAVLEACSQARYVDEFGHEYIDSQQPLVTFSIGASQARGTSHLDELIRDADFAMREVGDSQRKTFCWFETGMRDQQEHRRQLTLELREALVQRQIQPHFQPIVNLANGKIVAFEALARWQRDDGEFIPPDVFIDLAQRAHIIPELDAAIMQRSLQELARWSSIEPNIQLQVNLSLLSLSPDLPSAIQQLLEQHGLCASQLTVELTESWVLENNEQTTSILEDLNTLGVKIHLDDFGTGFSSLSHLQAFPIGGLKIDRSFVDLASGSERARKLIIATIGIARSLDIEVVAEGIETAEQESMLRKYGCEFGQGYHYSRPVASDKVLEMLEDHTRAA